MKKKHALSQWQKIQSLMLIPLIGLTASLSLEARAQNEKDLIASIYSNDPMSFDNTANGFNLQEKNLTGKLLEVFKNPKSNNFNRCSAAYYLGEMRMPEAAEPLADSITLQFDLSDYPMSHFPAMSGYSVMDALIKIGSPSIPAMIRNLAESDDAKVRDLSLKVLNRIDGDKDIVQLRLQKALNAEKDSQKQARLQAALKSLAETQLDK